MKREINRRLDRVPDLQFEPKLLNPTMEQVAKSGTHYHYENTPMQYTEIFLYYYYLFIKFHWKIFDIFNIFAQNIDCGYKLELPHRGGF